MANEKLSVCGCCKKDYGYNNENSTEKVIRFGFANMLCRVCRECLEDNLRQVAGRYLNKH